MDRILVVDDDASVRGIVAEVLTDDGYEVVEVESGDKALKAYKESYFKLVVSDIRMPGLDGISLLKELRAINANAHVVIMTSHVSVDNALKALKLGAYDYLVKPFESLDIISSMAKRAIDNANLAEERDRLITTLTRSNKELERLNRIFRDLAVRDGLTGLYNHRYFNEAVAAEVDRARRYAHSLSVIFLDVDHFKNYNDRHGHQAGDDLLKVLGKLLIESLRETDVVARWGGEEFVVMLPETGLEKAAQLAEKLRCIVAEYAFYGKNSQPSGQVTVSLGVAALKSSGTDSTLIYRADQAVYVAKNSGRNAVRRAN